MRNLGHELSGPRVLRRIEKRRLDSFRARRQRFTMLRRATGRRASSLWRTGALPSVGHGATVSGVSDSALKELRLFAAVLNGAPGRSSTGLTAYLISHKNDQYDPIYHATLQVVIKFSEWIWDSRIQPSRLHRAWEKLKEKFGGLQKVTWARARGPLAAAWLSLRRISWDLISSHAIRDDLGRVHDLRVLSPADFKHFLIEGVQRWQHDRLLRHLYTVGEGEVVPVWHRGLRYAIKEIRCVKRLGALQAHWADGIPIPARLDLKAGGRFRPCAACGSQINECWGPHSLRLPCSLGGRP